MDELMDSSSEVHDWGRDSSTQNSVFGTWQMSFNMIAKSMPSRYRLALHDGYFRLPTSPRDAIEVK